MEPRYGPDADLLLRTEKRVHSLRRQVRVLRTAHIAPLISPLMHHQERTRSYQRGVEVRIARKPILSANKAVQGLEKPAR